ncbi:MAG: ABC transporter permease [Candidatus Thorarchaeota archaeon]
MRTRDIFSYSFGSIRLRKVRSGLTTLGIVIGIAAIVALMSYTQGFEVAITNQFTEGFSTNTVTVSAQNFAIRPGAGTQPSDFTLYVNDTDLIESLEYVERVSPVISKQVTLNTSEYELSLSVIGIDFAAYQEIYSSTFIAQSGEIPSTSLASDAVIGTSVSDPWDNGTLFAEVGDEILISYTVINGVVRTEKNMTVTVVGILEEIGSSFGGPSDMGVYISIDTAVDFFETSEVNSIVAQLTDDSDTTIELVTSGISALFDGEATVTSPTAMLDQLSTMIGTIELLLGGIAAISLLVAGIGIMNIMIVSIMERTREIGILKALGAKGSTVLMVFLSEAMMIGIFGGVFGILTGGIIAMLLSGMLGGFSVGMGGGGQSPLGSLGTITPVITLDLIFMALFFGIVVSVVFALYPARRAANLQPVDALRNE